MREMAGRQGIRCFAFPPFALACCGAPTDSDPEASRQRRSSDIRVRLPPFADFASAMSLAMTLGANFFPGIRAQRRAEIARTISHHFHVT